MLDKDLSLEKVPIITDPAEKHLNRRWQGIPGLDRTRGGRLWVTFYSGGETEGSDNFSLLVKSDDDGETWSAPVAVVDPPGEVRSFDPCVWVDPEGRLWWFWAQSTTLFDGRCGVWAVECDDPDADPATWSSPRRIEDGIMLNKPTVLGSGRWLLPCAVWSPKAKSSPLNDLSDRAYSNVIATDDRGVSFFQIGSADVPDRHFDEHMIVELDDGRLWMLVRTFYGVGQSFSSDGGETWSPGEASAIVGPDSRFFIRRLRSGRLLLVNHATRESRSLLTAMLSEDGGRSWEHRLLLDQRVGVSYPDGVEDPEGIIRIAYDYSRRGEKEILMARFTEDDILAGEIVSKMGVLKKCINKA